MLAELPLFKVNRGLAWVTSVGCKLSLELLQHFGADSRGAFSGPSVQCTTDNKIYWLSAFSCTTAAPLEEMSSFCRFPPKPKLFQWLVGLLNVYAIKSICTLSHIKLKYSQSKYILLVSKKWFLRLILGVDLVLSGGLWEWERMGKITRPKHGVVNFLTIIYLLSAKRLHSLTTLFPEEK